MSWIKYRKVQNFFSPDRKRNKNENIATVSYKIKFIKSARFMASSLSNLVNKLAEGIHKIKFKDFNCFLNSKM